MNYNIKTVEKWTDILYHLYDAIETENFSLDTIKDYCTLIKNSINMKKLISAATDLYYISKVELTTEQCYDRILEEFTY